MKYNFLFFLLLFTACSSGSYELLNLDTAKKLVAEYYEKGKYDKECAEVFLKGKEEIEKLQLTGKSLVVFDVDETALSNYNHTKQMGFGYNQKNWMEWLNQADATAIKETIAFYNWLLSKNIKIAFLTGRSKQSYESTKKNLINVGYTSFDTLIVRDTDNHTAVAAEFKPQKREELVKAGYQIIACVGDQWSDLVGGNTGIKIKLPNYLYLID